MVTYQTNVVIHKPLKEVYDAVADYQKAPLWISGLQKIEIISGTPGEAGFRSRYTFVERGREAVFHEEVTAVVPYHSFSQHMESEQVILDGDVRFLEHGDGAKIIFSNKVKGKTFGMNLMLRFFKGMMRKRQEGDFLKLKALLEKGDTFSKS